MKAYCEILHQMLLQAIAAYEPRVSFRQDEWCYPGGGGGHTCVLRYGDVFDSAGVNRSCIRGSALPRAARYQETWIGKPFEAMGVSLVLHPKNPYAPTAHMNVRFFSVQSSPPVWWFGGGFDLTPYYPFREDVIFWHQKAKEACLPFGEALYPHYKAWADRYFYLPHRQETRGVGGLFFDALSSETWGWSWEQCLAFVQSVGTHFWLAYEPLLKKRSSHPFTEREQHFQQYRRGRYVEFNLVCDQGTLFGLQSGGRTESILMSLPPLVRWEYNWHPLPGSPEAQLEAYLQPQVWLP